MCGQVSSGSGGKAGKRGDDSGGRKHHIKVRYEKTNWETKNYLYHRKPAPEQAEEVYGIKRAARDAIEAYKRMHARDRLREELPEERKVLAKRERAGGIQHDRQGEGTGQGLWREFQREPEHQEERPQLSSERSQKSYLASAQQGEEIRGWQLQMASLAKALEDHHVQGSG